MIRLRWLIGLPRRWFPARGPAYRTIAAVLLLEVAGLAAWWILGNGRLGRVVLTSDTAPLKVQVLGESSDEPIGEPVDVNPTATLSLPAGDYRLRVTGTGRLSRTYRMAVNRGETLAHALNLDTGRLLGEEPGPDPRYNSPARTRPIPYTPTTTAVELTPGKADLVEWTPGSIVRRDGVTGEAIWDALSVTDPRARRSDLHTSKQAMQKLFEDINSDLRARRSDLHPWLLGLARRHESARLVEPAPDLNGDGTGDLVWKFWQEIAFLAVSGKDGSVLWTYVAELDGPGGAYPAGPPSPGPANPTVRSGYVIGEPAVADLDGDGRPDLIATINFDERPDEIARRSPGMTAEQIAGLPRQSRRVVVAISGRSGTRLWSRAVDPAWTPLQAGYRPATIVPGRKTSTVGIAVGATWLGLDPATGRPRSGPIDLGFEPERFLQYADLDGDGEPEVIAMDAGIPRRKLTAFSVATGRPLWTATIDTTYDSPLGEPLEDGWPMIADLDGDGRSEIVVPDSGALDARNGYHGVRALDGPTGRTRWTRPMRPDTGVDDWLACILAAPDLDHDGVRDILTITSYEFLSASRLGPWVKQDPTYVDALSGKDGRPLWWWHAEGPEDRHHYIVPPRWWGRGPDGYPLLAVTIGVMDPDTSTAGLAPSIPRPHVVTMLEASTGRAVQTLTGFEQTDAADLDGDGLPDLWGEYLGDLRAFRGEGPEAWRALETFDPARPTGGESQPATDLDGDGIGDTLTTSLKAPDDWPGREAGSRTALARSGRDGRLIWKSVLDVRRGWFDRDGGESYDLTSFPLPAGDLDGDGTPDVLVKEDAKALPLQSLRRPATIPLFLLSGRTGRPLWTAGPLPLGFEAHGDSEIRWAIPRVVEPGAPPDVLVSHDSPFLAAGPTPPPRGSPVQARLARVSGRTGNIIRDVPLDNRAKPYRDASSPRLGFRDLDGKTGLPRWKAHRESERPIREPVLLDPGGPERLPLIITHPQGTTVCRSAMPATSAGTLAPPRGTATPPGLARDDPRWARPLPWTDPILRLADLRGFLAVIGLALVNAVVPIGLLRLAARRRPWTIRLLMALPVAAALPLWVFQTVQPIIPTQIGATQVSPRLAFVLGTLAGLPIVIYAASVVANLFRRRWKALVGLAGLTVIASALIAAAWLWSDSRTMPAIEHYGRSDWYLVLVPGAYAAGVLILIAWPIRRAYRWLKTARRPATGTA